MTFYTYKHIPQSDHIDKHFTKLAIGNSIKGNKYKLPAQMFHSNQN